MLSRIQAVSPTSDLLDFTLDDSDTGLLIQGEPGGLGPVKTNIVSSEFATIDGTQYQSDQRGERNITFQVGLEPDYTVDEEPADLRDRLYDFFMPGSPVSLKFYDTKKTPRYTNGIVESCDPGYFQEEPTVDISIICNDPDMYDVTIIQETGNTTTTTNSVPLQYDGTSKTGIVFKLNVNRTMNAFTIYHERPDGLLGIMDFAIDLQAGDVVEVSTVRGNKYARLTRLGSTSSILYAVSPSSNWIEFARGENQFRVYATGAAVPWSLEYTKKYGGL